MIKTNIAGEQIEIKSNAILPIPLFSQSQAFIFEYFSIQEGILNKERQRLAWRIAKRQWRGKQKGVTVRRFND